jgi:hypothetical protein
MSDRRDSYSEPEAPGSAADMVEGAMRKLSTALIIAGALIAAAIYARPGPARYEALAAPNGDMVRLNTKTGAMIGCREQQCYVIVKQGQRLAKHPPAPAALPAPAAAAPQSPAAAAAPAAPKP